MDVIDLKVIDAVARHGSMNKAAVELNTVQSNVSSRIRSLEDELGVSLFQRSAKGVQITPAADASCLTPQGSPNSFQTHRPLPAMMGNPLACWKSAPWKPRSHFACRC